MMRQGSNSRRGRGRGNPRGNKQQGRNHTFDSNGPSGRFRGTAPQLHEKYLSLARDANASGDRIMAENFYQHADHYYRIASANNPQPDPHTDTSYDEGRFDARGQRSEHGDDDDSVGNRAPERQQRSGPEPRGGKPSGERSTNGRDSRGDDRQDADAAPGAKTNGASARHADGNDGETGQPNGAPDARQEEGDGEARPRQRRRRAPRAQAEQSQPDGSEQEHA